MDKKHTEALQRALDEANDYYDAHAFASMGPEGQLWTTLEHGHPLYDAVVALQRFYPKLRSGQNGLPGDARNIWRKLFKLAKKQTLSDADENDICDCVLRFQEWFKKQLKELGKGELTQAEYAKLTGLDPSTVSRMANTGTEMTLQEARNHNEKAATSRRSRRSESNAEVEEKSRQAGL